MGINSRLRDIRPPLPAPTDITDEGTSGFDTDAGTTLTTRTDKTSYEVPEDGSPIVISTQRISGAKEGRTSGHRRQKSQTSLLIEYFEGSTTGDKTKSKPSVRVKVTPSSRKKSGSGGGGHDAVEITGIGKDRKPSYTRRISLNNGKHTEVALGPGEGTEISHSSGSNLSGRPPVEVEVLDHNGSDLSTRSRGLVYAPYESNVSSMPAESMIDDSVTETDRSRGGGYDDVGTDKGIDYLQAPARQRSRSTSRERIAQRVMEKLGQPSKSRSNRSLGSTGGYSKSRQFEGDAMGGAESDLAPSQRSYRSGSDISENHNPKLLHMVKDTINTLILPEIRSIKEEQATTRRQRSYDDGRRGSEDGLKRRVSKSTSSPNISSKPKIFLNRDGEDPGTVLSRGDSERRVRSREERPSSRDGQALRPKSSRSSNTLRDLGAASVGAGILSAAAMRQHNSPDDVHARRKRRSKSRGSRSRSDIMDSGEDSFLGKEIPPMPMASQFNDSEVTRDSIVSVDTERPVSRGSVEMRTPIREVSRGSLGGSRSPASGPHSRGLGMSRENISIESPRTPNNASGRKGGFIAASRHVDADGYGGSPSSARKMSSPAQSVSSLKKTFEEMSPFGKDRPRSAASRSSAGRLRSGTSSPTARFARSTNIADDGYGSPPVSVPGTPGDNVEEWYERQHRVNDQYRDSMTESPIMDSVRATNRDSYLTNPYPQDEHKFRTLSEDMPGDRGIDMDETNVKRLGSNPQYVDTPPHGAQSAVASLMEPSTLSSLDTPTKGNGSFSERERMNAHLREMSKDSPPLYQGSTLSQTMPSQDRWTALKTHARNMSASTSQEHVPSPRQSPVKSLRSIDEQPIMSASGLPLADDPLPEIGHFDDTKSEVSTNPSMIKETLGGDPTGKSSWPYTPEPEKATSRNVSGGGSRSLKSGHSREEGASAALAAAAAAGATAMAMKHQPTMEDEEEDERQLTPTVDRRADPIDRNLTPTSPIAFRDEGYDTARSAGALTPRVEQQQQYSKADVDEFNRAMDEQDLGDDDPFSGMAANPNRNSTGSHGMASPLYDSSTGKGKDHIQSKDVVALMDHLTVRDAQRNARDTEILVTLVRTAAEMRQNFDEMKRFIAEQDDMIMQNAERGADKTVQKVLSGPRPQPSRSTTRQSEEDVTAKRKGVLRRALKGLTGGKSSSDLQKVETMLMQILDNVEDLKQQGGGQRQVPGSGSYTNDSLDTYEKLRNPVDSGYEPDGQAGTSSSASRSEQFSITPRAEKQQFHSGYDGRRGSENRVSTVLEGDEDDDLEPHESHVLNNQFENNERMITPIQELQSPHHAQTNSREIGNDITPRSTDKQRKHKSNNSSLFGVPKISRWSKTTASSGVPDPSMLDSPNDNARGQRPYSQESRSGSTLNRVDDENYDLEEDDRIRSTQSLAREQRAGGEARSVRSQVSKISRSSSPLIPSEASAKQRDEYEQEQVPSPVQEDFDDEDYDDPKYGEDPKYQGYRNSTLMQHPQPRQGTLSNHRGALETQAYDFDDSRTNSEISQSTISDFDPAMWGSSGTAGLAKHRLSQFEPLSPVSMASPGGGYRLSKDDPLIPQQQKQQQQKPPVPPKIKHDEPEQEPDWEPEPEPHYGSSYNRSYSYSSPWGSGHLLEPIEEVRYSLETDSGHDFTQEPQVASAKAVEMRSPVRKITGPRPMGSKLPNANIATVAAQQPRLVESSGTGTVRRKPVAASAKDDGYGDY